MRFDALVFQLNNTNTESWCPFSYLSHIDLDIIIYSNSLNSLFSRKYTYLILLSLFLVISYINEMKIQNYRSK